MIFIIWYRTKALRVLRDDFAYQPVLVEVFIHGTSASESKAAMTFSCSSVECARTRTFCSPRSLLNASWP
jgi:hypothetical protein